MSDQTKAIRALACRLVSDAERARGAAEWGETLAKGMFSRLRLHGMLAKHLDDEDSAHAAVEQFNREIMDAFFRNILGPLRKSAGLNKRDMEELSAMLAWGAINFDGVIERIETVLAEREDAKRG